ncbi:MAG TPA: hypothetical protein VNF71_06790 [Acidimicrobiales bacterium]|nr:hypothetical protein [Acidimicrobiales bacterium]
MPVALRVFVGVVGAAVVVATILSAIRTTVLPRGTQSRVSSAVVSVVRALFRLRARRSDNYESRDRIMAMLGPVALLAILASWLVLVLGGFTLIYLGVTDRSVSAAIELSGSSMFTLGTTTAAGVGPLLLTYAEAGIGLLILALLITYLPSIYGAFSRRENGVALLQVRAGIPPRAATMLIRFQLIEEGPYRLTELWRQWEAWFADVEETHSTFPILVFFRSPQPDRSWVTAAGALLDGAAFWVGAVEHPVDPDAQLCLRAGYLTLRRIAELFGIRFDPDPPPDGPISINRSEWEKDVDEMAAAGVPVKGDREAAWTAWKGWRVNYDHVLLELARLVEAPLAPWTSDRSPVSGI